MRVLVVEDEVRLARGLRIGLEREGSAVDVAVDGPEGVWFARENQYDVILLDLMLPVLNGHQVCQQLREDGNWTPILMLTARDGDLDQIEGLDAGADDYVAKPFNFEVLLARMRSLVRRGVTERPTRLVAGELTLDPASRTVDRAGEPIDLTAREFALLEFLMRQHGAVATKRQIMSNLWDFDFEGDSNTVEVFIARLRKKVDKPFGTDDIQTARGIGYRIRSDT
jgi:two-component system OmpR family response regulator